MRKLFVFNMVSVDGFFAGTDGNIDWHNVDEEFNEYAHLMLNSVDTILFGRTTYEMMASFWPTEHARRDDPVTAERMNALDKIVFSSSLESADWENTQIISDNLGGEVGKLKRQLGKDIVILGSGTIVQQCTNLGLVDEFHLMVNPIILGSGKPMFENVKNEPKLKLLDVQTFRNGNVALEYQAAK